MSHDGVQKYVLGFNIYDCRSLQLNDGEIQADIFITVDCCSKHWESNIKEEQAPNFVVWNEKQLWADIELLSEEFDSAYVEFNVWTRNWFSRNYLIGKASLQLKSINGRLGHVYSKKAVPLIKEGETEATGTITLTVYCLKPNEPPPNESQVEEEEQNNVENEDLANAVCGAKVETGDGRPHMIFIDIYKVDKLPASGWNGQFPSPFVTVEFAGNRVVTDHFANMERANINMQCRIPVMTPVFEDTILIKLWNKKMMSADELMAQGLISFSELRNKPMLPRWFCLYGYDANEITEDEVREIARKGEVIEPNHFKGQLLIGGRVDCLNTVDDLQPAQKVATRTAGEPAQTSRTILADVYEVCGAVGRDCQVEVSIGNMSSCSKWQEANWDDTYKEAGSDDDVDDKQENDELATFPFNQDIGRIDQVSLMLPEDRDSRPKIMINVYTRGVLSAKQRIGYTMLELHKIARYEPGNPNRPQFYPLTPMAGTTEQKTSLSVLMTVEQGMQETSQRHNRKPITSIKYVLRTYCFMARDIQAKKPQNFGLRVTCAGKSIYSGFKNEVRPMWMEATELKLMLNTDHKDEAPTMEPITVTLTVQDFSGYRDLGKCQCTYEYMRQKDTMGKWEQYKLDPQWIELYGGGYGTVKVAEVLTAFELIPWRNMRPKKDQPIPPELDAKQMWPEKEEAEELSTLSIAAKAGDKKIDVAQPLNFEKGQIVSIDFGKDNEEDIKITVPGSLLLASPLRYDHKAGASVSSKAYDDDLHFCKYRKATLHFSLLGLRDIVHSGGAAASVGSLLEQAGMMDSTTPIVTVLVKRFDPKAGKTIPRYYEKKFTFKDVCDGGDKRNKEDKIHRWETDSFGRAQPTWNYEFFQADKMNICLPDDLLLQPFVTVKVSSKRNMGVTTSTETIGEYRRSLNDSFPCSWYQSKNQTKNEEDRIVLKFGSYLEQKKKIAKFLEEGKQQVKARKTYEEETAEERKARFDKDREEDYDKMKKNAKNLVQKQPEEEKNTGPDGLPPQFHVYNKLTNKVGLKKQNKKNGIFFDERETLLIGDDFSEQAWNSLNYQTGPIFKAREGEPNRKAKGAAAGDVVDCDFEQSQDCDDFYYLAQPLLNDHDILDPDDKHNWNFEYNDCMGFVKCVFKLTDGWEAAPDLAEDEIEHGMAAGKDTGAIGVATGSKGMLQNLKGYWKGMKGFMNTGDSDVAPEEETAKQGHMLMDGDGSDLTVDDTVILPIQEGKEVSIYKDGYIQRSKIDVIKAHAYDLQDDLKTSFPKKTIQPVPQGEDEIRSWLKQMQREHLMPLVQTKVQKQLEDLKKRIQKEMEVVRHNPRSVLDELESLYNMIEPSNASSMEENDENHVKYVDFIKVGMQQCLRSLKDLAYSREVRDQIDKIRKRLRDVEMLATTFEFDKDRQLVHYAFDHAKFFKHYREAPPNLRVRLYFVKAICIFAKSYGSADPYLKFTIGRDELSLRSAAEVGTNEPDFYRMEERDVKLPQESKLKVDLCDIGDMPGGQFVGKQEAWDSLIGSTIMDLEDRWHSEDFQNRTKKNKIPRENRKLYAVDKAKQSVTGSLLMWVEMIDSKEAAEKKGIQLKKPDPIQVELRIVIWHTYNVKLVDNGKTDVKVRASLQCQEYLGTHPLDQETDVHHGSLGEAVFNWRMLYPKIVMPTKSCILTLSIYDYNMTGDDAIGQVALDIRKYIEKVASSMDTLNKTKNRLRITSGQDEDDGLNIGEIEFDMMVIPQTEADSKPVGIRREEPNENPQLMTPMEGRDWGSVLPSLSISFGFMGFYKKVLPLIFLTLLCLVGLKYVGLL